MSESAHTPVLLQQCLDALAIQPHGVYLDATFGRGGHSREIAKRLTNGRLYAIDRDPEAVAFARRELPAVTVLQGNFSDMTALLKQADVTAVDGILFDLGVSSPQIDNAERGFSYRYDAPLDMRMDTTQSLTARDIVNDWPQGEIKRILRDYGEERYADGIARVIVNARQQTPIETTGQLLQLIKQGMPVRAQYDGHPAMRSFQALRIAVNDELSAVESALAQTVPLLKPNGRLAVISFHSLEDRIVKRFMAEQATGCICPPRLPVCVCQHKPSLRIVSRKPIVADEEENQDNPRAHSAKLRVAERI